MLGCDILVIHLRCDLLCVIREAHEVIAHAHLGAVSRYLGSTGDRLVGLVLYALRICADTLDDGRDVALAGIEQRLQQMDGLQSASLRINSHTHSALQRFLSCHSPFVDVHIALTSLWNGRHLFQSVFPFQVLVFPHCPSLIHI